MTLLVALVVPLVSPAAKADTYVPISGAGSTWASNAIDFWRRDVDRIGLPVNYAPTGSSDGRVQFRNGTTDFAVSELAYGVADQPPTTRSFAYLPVLANDTAFVYNLTIGGTRITNLQLSGETVAKIFTRVITSWDGPAIQAENPQLTLPALAIVPVVRSDGSGTTMQFTRWLADRHWAIWNDFCQRAGACDTVRTHPVLPPGARDRGKGAVPGCCRICDAELLRGAITYAESIYARNASFPTVKLRNEAGAYVEPVPSAVTTALLTAQIRLDLTQDLTLVYRNQDRRAYPLSSYVYAIVPVDTRLNFTTLKGRSLSTFLQYSVCQGQDSIAFGYAPLPPHLVRAALDQIARIPGASATASCNPPAPGGDQDLAVTVLPGDLTISVDNRNVILPTPTLAPDGELFVTSGQLNPIQVTDTRAGNPGWNLVGQVGHFSDGAGHQINGANLGWSPSVLTSLPVQVIIAGPIVPPADGLLPGAPSPVDTGLLTSRLLASAVPGAGVGTATFGAALALNVPTSTTAGTYTATLTPHRNLIQLKITNRRAGQDLRERITVHSTFVHCVARLTTSPLSRPLRALGLGVAL